MANKNQMPGNKNPTYTLKDIADTIVNYTMKQTNVAEVVKVETVDDTNKLYRCSLISNPDIVIECTSLQALEISVNDIMLCIFTSTDFRTNLAKFKNELSLQKYETATLHSKNYGVLIGLIYRKGEQK